jgi:hypothetical protein
MAFDDPSPAVRCRHACTPCVDAARPVGDGEPVSPEAAGALPRPPRETETPGPDNTSGSGSALTTVGLASASNGGSARHAHQMASSGLAAPLAVEVAIRTAADPTGSSSTHREHGPGEPDLGRRTDRERTARETGPNGVTAHGRPISPDAAATPRQAALTAVGDVCAESCAWRRGL